MDIVHNYLEIPESKKGAIVALGNFDGIHQGHQYILEQTKTIARENHKAAAVVTFEPHPMKTLQPRSRPFRLTSEEQKMALIAHMGIERCFVIRFTKLFSKMTGEEFIENILIKALGVSHLITGDHFTFGHKRQGTIDLLETYAKNKAFSYTKMATKSDGKDVYSSTKIRNYLKKGQIMRANKLLGRPFSISGRIEKGNQIGQKIGFPTANLSLNEWIRPKLGVYASKLTLNNKIFPSVTHIGIKPTIGKTEEILETHIFDFHKNIYDEYITVELVECIRAEKKFHSLKALKTAIEKDCKTARKILNQN